MFSVDIIDKVWRQGRADAGRSARDWRLDDCGDVIKKDQYGDRSSRYGWEIDHIKPASEGGTNALSNLRPLHWENNVRKQQGRLKC